MPVPDNPRRSRATASEGDGERAGSVDPEGGAMARVDLAQSRPSAGRDRPDDENHVQERSHVSGRPPLSAGEGAEEIRSELLPARRTAPGRWPGRGDRTATVPARSS